VAERVAQVLDAVRMSSFVDRYPRQLSGGQQHPDVGAADHNARRVFGLLRKPFDLRKLSEAVTAAIDEGRAKRA
jgi:ABC-type nitrate/sulfonate/bicarbonate transport system ATPase subunit